MTDLNPSSEQIESPSKTSRNVYATHPLGLGSKNIRVLDVLPTSTTSDNEDIQAALRVLNLDTDTGFTALSYVWGCYAAQRHTILCDGVRLEVTSNCHSALWHLRKKLGGFTIWLDAICINQEDLEEKSQQIPLMCDIYTKADLVYVWLGRGSPSSDRAMAYLLRAHFQNYCKIKPDGAKEYSPKAAAWSLYTSRFSIRRHPYPFGGSSKPWIFRYQYVNWTDLEDVLKREWIRRVWTYQEILLAARPILVCGDFHLPWANLEKSVLFLRNVSYEYYKEFVTPWESIIFNRQRLSSWYYPAFTSTIITTREYEAFVQEILTGRQLFTRGTACLILGLSIGLIIILWVFNFILKSIAVIGWAITTVLFLADMYAGLPIIFFLFFKDTTRGFDPNHASILGADDEFVRGLYHREAKEPEDMAYGIWSILKRRGAIDLPEPIYTRSTGEIYWILTLQVIGLTDSLEFLFLAAARGQIGAPSWVPDWTGNRKHAWVSKTGLPGTDTQCWSLQGSKEVAETRDTEIKGRFLMINQTRSVLTVLARDLGHIRGYASFHKTSTTYQDSEKGLHLENLQTMYLCATWIRDLGLDMGKTLLAKTAADEDRYPKNLHDWDKVYTRSPRRTLDKTFRCFADGGAVPLWFHTFLATQILMCNLLARQDRKICRVELTEYPHELYVTACSPDAQVDDRVFRIWGLLRPLVVRRLAESGQSVRIVSPMFVETAYKWCVKSRRRLDKGNLATPFSQYQIH